jgi:nucleotide-binding universal stress UspA family protein
MARKIIIGYDPEHHAKDALRLGRLLSAILAARPLVVTVEYWPPHLLGPADLEAQLEHDTAEPFAVAVDELAGLDPETRVVSSQSPAESLQQIADEERAILLLLGSSHRGTAGRTLLGSVALSLLNGAPCAIAVAPAGYGGKDGDGLLRIAIAFDGSAESWAALETGIGIAERTHGELTLITVADDPMAGLETSYSILTKGEFHDFDRVEKQRILDLGLSRVPPGMVVEGRLVAGDAGEALSRASGDFDLLLAGSRRYGPLRRTLLGSATRRLLPAARCPVIVLPRGVGVDPLGVGSAGPTRAARLPA